MGQVANQLHIIGLLICASILVSCGTSLEDICSNPDQYNGEEVDINDGLTLSGGCTQIGCDCCNLCEFFFHVACPLTKSGSSSGIRIISTNPDFPEVTYSKSGATTRFGCLYLDCQTPSCTPIADLHSISEVTGTFTSGFMRSPPTVSHTLDVSSFKN
jgi:hypothetical protein